MLGADWRSQTEVITCGDRFFSGVEIPLKHSSLNGNFFMA